jgi:hypothetical protein
MAVLDVSIGYAECRFWRIENPRAGGSVPPLAIIQIKAFGENDTDVSCPTPMGLTLQVF